jgi:hypothetical protein
VFGCGAGDFGARAILRIGAYLQDLSVQKGVALEDLNPKTRSQQPKVQSTSLPSHPITPKQLPWPLHSVPTQCQQKCSAAAALLQEALVLPAWTDAYQSPVPPCPMHQAIFSLMQSTTWQDIEPLLPAHLEHTRLASSDNSHDLQGSKNCAMPKTDVSVAAAPQGSKDFARRAMDVPVFTVPEQITGTDDCRCDGTKSHPPGHGHSRANVIPMLAPDVRPDAVDKALHNPVGSESAADTAALGHLRHAYSAGAEADLGLLHNLVAGVLSEASSGLPPRVVSMCSNIVECYAGVHSFYGSNSCYTYHTYHAYLSCYTYHAIPMSILILFDAALVES